ncbi:DnaD domain protein [Bacillus timonensis]|nr:DnaD domain protein [Bacillus timonensis]
MSHLLLQEHPLVVIPSLATTFGLNESIVLQQIHYWLDKSKHEHDGHKWIYNSYEEWQLQFPFWSVSTIRRTITKLEKLGLIVTGNFNRNKIDQTKWYRLNYEMFEQLIGAVPPPPDQNEQTNEANWQDEMSNVNKPIPESTSKTFSEKKKSTTCPFAFFEENGFGTVGAHLSEKINAWCTDLNDELVIEAMKLAIENGVKTWAYVEAILRDWIDKGYERVEDIHSARRALQEKQSSKRANRTPYKRPIRQEVVPSWLQTEQEPFEGPTDDFLKEKQELQNILKSYKK